MKKLIQGLREFKTNYFSANLELFEELVHGQHPRVLFITCSDSRIIPSLLTQTDVGDLFVIRNAGNIIPPYGAANGGEGATLEYAIDALGVEQIVVCGHSHCGAMKGLLQLGELEQKMPLVYEWLRHAEATRRLVHENYQGHSKEELLEIMVAENVLTQIENIRTYPVVRSKLYQGKMHIYAWVYLIETGEVLAYDPETHSYMHPQSQIFESEATPSGKMVRTMAPPVACELPGQDSDFVGATSRPISLTSTHDRSPYPAPSGNSRPVENGFSDLWLSHEQADRIYRGVAKTSTQK
jgi:carbonic anhydrase